MRKYWNLYKMFFRINFMKDMAYRANFITGMILVCFESVTVFFLVRIIFNYIENIAGWSYYEMLVLSGIFMLSQSVGWLFYKGGIAELDGIINRGDFDWFLVKPVDAQFISTVQRIDLEDSARSFVGVFVIILGLSGSGIQNLVWHLPIFFFTFLCGQIVMYSIYIMMKTISFKSIQGWATNSTPVSLHELTQYPTDIYKGFLRILYSFIIPLLFVATVPARALLGTLSWQLFVGSIVATVGSFVISRWVWKKALRGYSSASS